MSKIIVANMKMSMTLKEIAYYIKVLNDKLDTDNDIIIAPSFIFLPYFKSDKYLMCAQDVSEYESGPYTGEVSALQLKSINVKYTIVGHSERRSVFHENSAIIHNKIKHCLDNDISPIVCIGEDKKERISMTTEQFLRRDILELLQDFPKEQLENVIIAYEPKWAIGTGITPTPKEIDETIFFIKDIVESAFKVDVKVLYGGSINKENISDFKKLKNVDGFLIGGSSTDIDEFLEIIEQL